MKSLRPFGLSRWLVATIRTRHFEKELGRLFVGNAVVLFDKSDLVTLSATGVTLPKPQPDAVLPNGKGIVLVRVKRTGRTFLRVNA